MIADTVLSEAKDLNADDRRCVYLLIGDEEFLKEEWLRNAKQKFLNPTLPASKKLSEERKGWAANADFNLFFANDIDLPNVLSIARTRPFLSAKRVIIIKDIASLKSESDRGQLLSYIKAPSTDTILILETDAGQRDYGRDEFLSEIGRSSQVVFFKKLYGAGLYNWISQRASLRKKRIEPAACELLKDLKGNNLNSLDGEIEKLSLYAGDKPLIAKADVQQLVGRDCSAAVYDIINAMSQNDKKRVLALSFDFQKGALGATVGLFCWNLRLLLRAKEYIKEGLPIQEIGNALGLQKFRLERIMNQARRVDADWLKVALSELTQFDLQIKSSAFADPILGWQMLLVRLVGQV